MGNVKNKRLFINLIVAIGILCFLSALAIIFREEIFAFLGKLFSGEMTQDMAKEYMRSFSWKGAVVIGFLSSLQVIFTVLPAEPIQVVAGMAYGLPLGVGICIIGVAVGNTVIFALSRTVGDKLSGYFKSKINFKSTGKPMTGKLCLIVFIMYFLPAIPYGLICFIAASGGIKFWKYFLLTTLCALPSVIIGAGLGVIAINVSFIVTLIVLAALIVLIIIMFCMRSKIFAYINAKLEKAELPHSTATTVKKPSRFIIWLTFYTYGRAIRRKVKLHYRKLSKAEREQIRGSVIISNHPSFIDWIYMGIGLYPLLGNFIIARYYFFHRRLAWLLRNVGGFPKSMFTTDIESIKNTMRVGKAGGTLCLLPEARLSTVGMPETIQPVTAKLIKSLKKPVFAFNINGAYLAKPKWGSGIRVGGEIEMKFGLAISLDEVKSLSEEEILGKLTSAIEYNDFEWLKTRPNISYKSKNIAEGLENILFICPECGARFSMATSGAEISCGACGHALKVNSRYGFEPQCKFENFQQWYKWQESVLSEEITDDYILKDSVRVKLPSHDGKTFFREAGEGECALSQEGFKFVGVIDNKPVQKSIPLANMYRILFGAGEDFEIYDGAEFYYFIPEDTRRCSLWYIASGILYERYCGNKLTKEGSKI